MNLDTGAVFANITKLGKSAAKQASKASKVFADNVSSAALSRVHQDYEIGSQTCTAGLGWKIHRAVRRKKLGNVPGAPKAFSVWFLHKQELYDNGRCKAPEWKTFIDLLESDSRQTSRLRHPGIVRLIEPLEESRSHYTMVTEEVLCSLQDWLAGSAGPVESDRTPPTELEAKEGLMALTETLTFLHTSCHIAHCNVAPHSVLVAADGSWRLSGFGFAATIHAAADSDPWNLPLDAPLTRYGYGDGTESHLRRVARPTLRFTAPELVDGVGQGLVTGKADAFSLACLAYAALRRQPLFTRTTILEYRTALASLHLVPVDGLHPSLQAVLSSMLAQQPVVRPDVAVLTESAFFRDDRLLRALRFLTTILERDAPQKHAFVRDLPAFWRGFPPRVLRFRVLPVLLGQWRDAALRDALLPLVLQMVQGLPDVFQGQLLEALHALPGLQAAMRMDQAEDVAVPVLLRGLATPDARFQDAALAGIKVALEKVGNACLHDRLLPALLATCLRTTSAAVRGGVLATLAAAAPRLTVAETDTVVKALVRTTGVDKSASTLMATLQLCTSLSEARPADYTANVLLPLLLPLTLAQALKPGQFRAMMEACKSMLRRIEQWRLHGGATRAGDTRPGSPAGTDVSWDDAPPGRVAVASAASSHSGGAPDGALGPGSMTPSDAGGWGSPIRNAPAPAQAAFGHAAATGAMAPAGAPIGVSMRAAQAAPGARGGGGWALEHRGPGIVSTGVRQTGTNGKHGAPAGTGSGSSDPFAGLMGASVEAHAAPTQRHSHVNGAGGPAPVHVGQRPGGSAVHPRDGSREPDPLAELLKAPAQRLVPPAVAEPVDARAAGKPAAAVGVAGGDWGRVEWDPFS